MVVLFDQDPLIYKAIHKVVDFQTIKQWFYQGKSKDWMHQEITDLAINRMCNMADTIFEQIEATGISVDDVEYYITVCARSKRKRNYPDYKIKRKPNKWVNMVRKYLIDKNYAVHNDEWESDDLIADKARELGETEALICTLDKDFVQIPGVKFNYYKKPSRVDENGVMVHYDIKGLVYHSKEDAEFHFWMSMLTGDHGDGIKGVPGIGPVKAAKKLLNSDNYRIEVQNAYKETFPDTWRSEFDKSYFLLYLGTKRDLSEDALTEALNDSIRLTKTMEGLLK